MASLPNSSVRLLLQDGTLALPWRLFFQNVYESGGNSDAIIIAIQQAIAHLNSEVAILQNEVNALQNEVDASFILSAFGIGAGEQTAASPLSILPLIPSDPIVNNNNYSFSEETKVETNFSFTEEVTKTVNNYIFLENDVQTPSQPLFMFVAAEESLIPSP